MVEPSPAVEGEVPYTFINVFEIDPDAIDTFIERWLPRSRFMRSAPGYIDGTLYRAVTSDTRFQLVNLTNWTSRAAHEAATGNPEYREELNQFLTDLGSKLVVNRGHYETVAHVLP